MYQVRELMPNGSWFNVIHNLYRDDAEHIATELRNDGWRIVIIVRR